MKYIQLLNQRINLENIAHYYPHDNHTGVINKDTPEGYEYVIRFIVNAGGTLTLQYADKKQRDLDLQTLDFICVSNKRGDVQELRKAQNE